MPRIINFYYLCTRKEGNVQKNTQSVKIKVILEALEHFAPLPLQESWDNAGLQVGLTETDASGALLCLDVNEDIVDEAIEKGCNLIVSHHPLLFRGLKQVSDANYVQRIVMKAVKNDIAIISMHTNMDNAKNGVNYKIAEKLGLTDVRFLDTKQGVTPECGSGVIGEFASGMDAEAFIMKVKETFGCGCVMTNEPLQRGIKRVAICGGAGAFLLDEAVKANADAFITGEMHYHEYFDHEQEIQIAVIGHYESEHFTTEIFRDIIASVCPCLRTEIATTNTNPIRYY